MQPNEIGSSGKVEGFVQSKSTTTSTLSDAQIAQFIVDGYIKIEDAFSQECAGECRAILWRDSGCTPDDPATWTKPIIRLNDYRQLPFRQAANSPVLHHAFDELVGRNRWLPRESIGTCPIRFPSTEDPGDTGWHIDASFGLEHPDFMSWRTNVFSRGRSLLMLFLFSDIGHNDAPTRIRVGSHRNIARILEPAGEHGMSLRELASDGFASTAHLPETLATGKAGSVYLCHPFLVHAAQPHHGTEPRFLGQPPLYPAEPFNLNRDDGQHSPVEEAIRRALL